MNLRDAIVIGAGPAGLTAVVYLGRFRRACLVLSDDQSRARWIPTSHNIPGFVTGVGGKDFLDRLETQATLYGAEIRADRVTRLSVSEGIFTVEGANGERWYSRFVLLATGVRDHLPKIPGASEAVLRSVLRFCPICDAFEAVDKSIAVLGNGPLGEREDVFLAHYSERVTLLQLPPDTAKISIPQSSGETVGERLKIVLEDLILAEDRVLLRRGNVTRDFDVMYLALGCSPQH